MYNHYGGGGYNYPPWMPSGMSMHHPRVVNPTNGTNNDIFGRIRQSQLKNQQLRKKLREAKLSQAREMLRQKNQYSIRQLETCIEKIETLEKQKKEEALETLLRDTLNQTKEVAEQLAQSQQVSTEKPAAALALEKEPSAARPARRPRRRAVSMPDDDDDDDESSEQSVTNSKQQHSIKSESVADEVVAAAVSGSSNPQPAVEVKLPAHVQPDEGWGDINPADLGWTEEDQKLFEEEDELDELDDEQVEKESKSLAEIEQEKKEREMKAKRKLDLARHGDSSRRPRWRLEEEDQDLTDEQLENRMMDPIEVFRSGVYAVLFTRFINQSYIRKKLSTRDEEQQDMTNMMNLYFDSTRVWLSKIVRVPVVSILQDPKLNFERAIVKPKNKLLPTLRNQGGGTDKMLLIKMRVRVKGIIDAIIKSTEKKKVPQSIVNFLKRMTTDGIYFPENYLFPQEVQQLELNQFGATVNMHVDFPQAQDDDQEGNNGVLSGDKARCKMLICNLLLTRILIPHIVLEPWTCSIGSKPKHKKVLMNLKIVASLLFIILRREFPLFAPGISALEEDENNTDAQENNKAAESSRADDSEVEATPGTIKKKKAKAGFSFFKRKQTPKEDDTEDVTAPVAEKEEEKEETEETADSSAVRSDEEETKPEAPVEPDPDDEASTAPAEKDSKDSVKIDASKFYSADHISAHLFSHEYFTQLEPELQAFLHEQQLRLRGWIRQLLQLMVVEVQDENES